MVFYLKYRPQKIEDLDIESVRDTLKSVLGSYNPKKKNLSFHALLFTGPKGLGKTSTARIVAKILNCERLNANNEPCNKCYQCKSITNGNNLDVVEIDAASNRGIDEIRELKERINLGTAASTYKIYIIDEVHMLTQEAFNALLKTLEEPPSHVVFILCTTEPQKLPATIISRCMQISFRSATEEELIRSFKRIIAGEKLNIDKEVLSLIAHLSDGSFRDGSKILQELSAKAGKKRITAEFVEKEYKVSGISYQLLTMVGFIEERNVKSSLEVVQKLVDEGTDMKFFMEKLIDKLHSLLLSKIDGKEDTKMSLEELKKLLELLMTASSQIKYSVLPQLPLELAIVEYSISGNSDTTQKASESEIQNIRKSETPIIRQSGSPSIPSHSEKSDLLEQLIVRINPQNRSVAGLLRGTILKSTNGKKVLIETKYKFHKEKLEERKTKDLIEKIASEILKKNVTIELILKSGGD